MVIAVKLSDKIFETSKALGDETRFSIYSYLSQRSQPISVCQLAEEFSLHPNVIRMHLSKLEEANLIISQIGRESCVGRPQRLYQRNPELVEFHLPPRDYRFLCELLLGLIARSNKITDQEIEEFGREQGRSFVHHRPGRGSESNLEIVGQWLAEELSYFDTNVELTRSSQSLIEIQNRNCIFKEAAEINPSLVCNLHQAVVKGMLDTVLSRYQWETYSAIVLGDEICRVRISVDSFQK